MDERSGVRQKEKNQCKGGMGVRMKKSLIDRGCGGGHQERRSVRGKSVPLQRYQGMISRWEGRERGTRGTVGEMGEIKQREKRGGEVHNRSVKTSQHLKRK